MDIDILSLFPDYFRGPFDESIIKRAREKGIININHVDLRSFGSGKHKRVDDRPYGGGPGMVLKPEPLKLGLDSVKRSDSHVIYVSAQGQLLDNQMCKRLSTYSHLILLAGHYEGIDERIIRTYVNEEISIGDYVLTNGALASIVIVDALIRFVPGVLGNEESCLQESFEEGIFDCPHYTRPSSFEGQKVPEVLLSGDHEAIRKWRREEAVKKTKVNRPKLYSGLNFG